MHLVPNFYSLDAERLALDADPAIDAPITYNFQVKLYYRENKQVYGNEYANSTALTKTAELIQAINQHFENEKPTFSHTTPFFIDWVDTNLMKKRSDNIEQIVAAASDMYYGGAFDKNQYGNVLPPSAKTIPGVNDFVMPWSSTTGKDIFNKRIRLRLWLAPFCKIVFSNIQVFVEDLGFEPAQMGRDVQRQIHLINSKPLWTVMAIAQEAPKEQFTKSNFKIRAWTSGPYLHTKIKPVTLTKREWLNNDKLLNAVAAVIEELSWSLNTTLSFSFDKTEKRFFVTFPDSDLLMARIMCDPDFSHRIGMGYEPALSKDMKAEPQKDRFEHTQDAAKRSAAVVFDTGPIACVLDEMSSNTTSQSVDQIMTSLYPTASGTLAMPSICNSGVSRAVPLSVNRYSGNATSSITFRLLRIYDDQHLANFAWTCDSYIYGVLQGTCLLSRYNSINSAR